MKLFRNIVITILFFGFYAFFIKSYFFDRYLFESAIYVFGLYISGHLFFIFYKSDKFFGIGLFLMSIIVCVLSKSYDFTSILQILLFHLAIGWMAKDIDFAINYQTNVNRRSLMMYSCITFITLISIIFAIKIATVPSNFSCEILRNKTSQTINYITLSYPRSQIKELFNQTQLNNIINGRMSNILGIATSTGLRDNNLPDKIIITDGASGLYVSELTGTKLLTGNISQNPSSSVNQFNININNNLTNDSINNENNFYTGANTGIIAPQGLLGKLEFYENMIINNLINDKSLVDKGICEYTYEQVKARQKYPEFIISSIILLFAILYPFFRFIFYIVGFVGRLILLLLSKLGFYKISSYYQKVEKLE